VYSVRIDFPKLQDYRTSRVQSCLPDRSSRRLSSSGLLIYSIASWHRLATETRSSSATSP